MTRLQLIERVQREFPLLSHDDVDAIVRLFFEQIVEHLGSGGTVELRGFGTFQARQIRGRIGRNPKSGVAVTVPPKKKLHFKQGIALKVLLNAPENRPPLTSLKAD